MKIENKRRNAILPILIYCAAAVFTAVIFAAFIFPSNAFAAEKDEAKKKNVKFLSSLKNEIKTISGDDDGAAMIVEEEEELFDESDIIESLNNVKTKLPAARPPRMNNPPVPRYWEGFDYDTFESGINEVLSRFKASDEYYEPRYKHYQDDETYQARRLRRDKISNLINAQSIARRDAETEKLLADGNRQKRKNLSYPELIDFGVQRLLTADFKNALRFFSKASAADPRQPEAYYNIALVYFYRNNVPQAIINFKRAIDLKPDLAEAYNNIGVCFVRANLIEKGLTQFRQANIYAPSMKEAIYNLDELKNKDTDYNYNDKLFREKHAIDSSSPSRIFSVRLKICPPVLNLSNIQKDETRICLDNSVSENNRLTEEYQKIILNSYPDINTGFKTNTDISNNYNKYWDALNLLKIADELYEKKLYKESEQYYTRVIKMLPEICSVYLKRGFTRLELKNLRGAEYDFSFAAKNSDEDDIVREAIKQIQQIRVKKFDSF